MVGWTWTLFLAQYDYQLLDDPATNDRALWLTAVLGVALMLALAWIGRRYVRGSRAARIYSAAVGLVALAIAAMGTAFGLVLTANALLDARPPIVHRTTVVDHAIRNGKSTRYLVALASWSPDRASYTVVLSRTRYSALGFAVGDCARIGLGDGALGLRWIASLEKLPATQCRP